jgi:hypothetical protein
MSSTWEEPEEGAPTEAPSPSDAPTGAEGDDQKTSPKQAEKNRAEDPPA